MCCIHNKKLIRLCMHLPSFYCPVSMIVIPVLFKFSRIMLVYIALQITLKVTLPIKVRKAAKIRNPYNQVPHLTQDTTWECDKNTIKHHEQEPRGQHFFPAGDHKAAMNRRKSMKNTRQMIT